MNNDSINLKLSLGPSTSSSTIPPSTPHLTWFLGPSSSITPPHLTLSLGPSSSTTPPPSPPPSAPLEGMLIPYSYLLKSPHTHPQPLVDQTPPAKDRRLAQSNQVKAPRRSRKKILKTGKTPTIPQPFQWAAEARAKVETLETLVSKGITTISDQVRCRRCHRQYQMSYDLPTEFKKLWNFVARDKTAMSHRAPDVWMDPDYPKCEVCGHENSLKPIIAKKRREINWLFLLLGQFIGCCTLKQLKYFCKHNYSHRTGAKNRVVYLTYLNLCKQLDPTGPFDPLDLMCV
ncbi:hypothetical protein UlMin_032375 [Ulmus minor]